mgnify:CR=1 FL=1
MEVRGIGIIDVRRMYGVGARGGVGREEHGNIILLRLVQHYRIGRDASGIYYARHAMQGLKDRADYISEAEIGDCIGDIIDRFCKE